MSDIKSDLTSLSYWESRQKGLHPAKDQRAIKDLLDALEPFLRPYKNQRWIELGCSPGHMSSLLFRRIPFIPSGIDFSPQAHLYVETMAHFAGVDATLFQVDVREFTSAESFDVVMSFGLIEHFSNPKEILFHHIRLCKPGGLVVVTIPHFRYLQWVYHYLFDRSDLARHNLSIMNIETFRGFSEEYTLEVLYLGYVGRIQFWNVDETGPRMVAATRKLFSILARGVAAYFLAKVFPPNKKLYAPWIVFVARRI